MKRDLFQRVVSLAQNSTKTLITGCSMAALCTGLAHADTNDGNWYFFGDSNLGQGNFSAIVGSEGQDFYPYSSNNGFERDSNGLIWAEMLDRDVDIILDPDLNSNNINFAISGAHMTAGGDLVPYGLETGVRVQTQSFRDLVENGAIATSQHDVAFMIAGANDFLDRTEAGEDTGVIMADVATAAVSNLADLAASGIRTVILSEIQPLQYAPIFADDTELQAELADMVTEANETMFSAIDQSGIRADMNIVTMKYNDFMQYLTGNASMLGFDNTNTACYDGQAETLCAESKEGQDKYVFIDELHMTEKAQSYVAKWWQATLAGANGDAARIAARMPDVVQYSAETVQNRFNRKPNVNQVGDLNVFADVIYNKPTLKGLAQDPDIKLTLKGALVGVEAQLGKHTFAGGGLSLTKGEAKFSEGSKFDSTTKALHGWIGTNISIFSLTSTSQYGELDIDDLERSTGLPGYAASGKSKGTFWLTSTSASSEFDVNGLQIDLAVTHNYGKTKVNGFNETGAQGLALSYNTQTKVSEWLTASTHVKAPTITVSKKLHLTPFTGFQWRYTLGKGGHDLTSRLLENTAQDVTIQTNGNADHRYTATVGATLDLTERWSLRTSYNHTWAKDIKKGNMLTVGMSVHF